MKMWVWQLETFLCLSNDRYLNTDTDVTVVSLFFFLSFTKSLESLYSNITKNFLSNPCMHGKFTNFFSLSGIILVCLC